jgi:hypothetical protein
VIFYTTIKKQVEYDESISATGDAHREKRLEMSDASDDSCGVYQDLSRGFPRKGGPASPAVAS